MRVGKFTQRPIVFLVFFHSLAANTKLPGKHSRPLLAPGAPCLLLGIYTRCACFLGFCRPHLLSTSWRAVLASRHFFRSFCKRNRLTSGCFSLQRCFCKQAPLIFACFRWHFLQCLQAAALILILICTAEQFLFPSQLLARDCLRFLM